MRLKRLFLYRTNEGKLYYATSPTSAKRYFSGISSVTTAVFSGEEMVPIKLLERIGRGVYRLERRDADY